MQDRNDRIYYRARAEKERALAAQAKDVAIRKVHAEMAQRYDMLVADEQAPAVAQAQVLVSR